MRMHVTVTKLKLNQGRLLKAYKDVIKEHIIESAAIFGQLAAPNVPIDTGMARGTFLNLLHLIEQYGYSIEDIPVAPRRTNKNGTPIKYYHVGGSKHDKTPETAKKYSTQTNNILKVIGNKYTFNYQTTVVHYNILDTFGTSTQSTWDSYQIGRAGFLLNMKLLRNKMPNLQKYLTKTTVSLGKGAPSGYNPFTYTRQGTN